MGCDCKSIGSLIFSDDFTWKLDIFWFLFLVFSFPCLSNQICNPVWLLLFFYSILTAAHVQHLKLRLFVSTNFHNGISQSFYCIMKKAPPFR